MTGDWTLGEELLEVHNFYTKPENNNKIYTLQGKEKSFIIEVHVHTVSHM